MIIDISDPFLVIYYATLKSLAVDSLTIQNKLTHTLKKKHWNLNHETTL